MLQTFIALQPFYQVGYFLFFDEEGEAARLGGTVGGGVVGGRYRPLLEQEHYRQLNASKARRQQLAQQEALARHAKMEKERLTLQALAQQRRVATWVTLLSEV